jgi:hypothetical protein
MASDFVQQIDVTVLLGAGETAIDGSRLVVLHCIRHFAPADHALALAAVQVGRVTQTALTTLWPSVEAEEVPTSHDQLHGAHAPKIIQISPVRPGLWIVQDQDRPGPARDQLVELSREQRETRRSGLPHCKFAAGAVSASRRRPIRDAQGPSFADGEKVFRVDQDLTD